MGKHVARDAKDVPVTDPTPADPVPALPKPLAFPGRDRVGAPLPASLTTFVGREREVLEVAARLRRSNVRLVTLTGPGGVGKTRLSLKVAEELAVEFVDGVAFIDLTSVTEPNKVAPTVAQAFDVREADDRSVADRLVDALRDRRLLLVFDNFEPVVAAAPLVARLLSSCPRMKVLVTSREPLHLAAEWVVGVGPLMLPDSDRSVDDLLESEAVRLFVERAQAVRSDFALTDATARSVTGIVHRVEGLPLAIELAAARLAHLPPAALLQRLEHRLPLLTGGARDLPDRQRTLRGTIAWSYDLLPPEEQWVFRRLAVFVGGCTLEAAECIANTHEDLGGDALDVLGSLVSKSLLRQEEDHDAGPRFTMLETVREYGLEQLAESGDEQITRDQHAAYFLELAERADPAIWGGPDHARWLDRLETEFANLRAALAWFEKTGDGAAFLRLAAALGGLWHYRSHRVEGRAWLNRALVIGGDTVPLARAMACIKLGMLERVLGGSHPADLVMQGLALRRQMGDQRGIGRALMNLGNVLKDQTDYDRAISVLEEAVPILEQVSDIGGLATTRMYLGMAALEQGDMVRAETLLTDALALHHQDGFTYGVASTLLALGRIEAHHGDVGGAAARFTESLRLWAQVKSQEGVVDAMTATAELAVTCGRLDSAARLLGAASAIGEALGYVAPQRDRERRECAAKEARSALGEQPYAVAWDAGHMLSASQAAAEATDVLGLMRVRTVPATGTPADTTGLTPREQDVLRLLVEGRSDRDIAQALGISYRTVTSYVRNILAKFDATSRTAVAAEAVRRGLV